MLECRFAKVDDKKNALKAVSKVATRFQKYLGEKNVFFRNFTVNKDTNM